MRLKIFMAADFGETMKLIVDEGDYIAGIERATDLFVREYGGYPWRMKVKAA